MNKSPGIPPRRLARRNALLVMTADLLERAQFELSETYRFEITEQNIFIKNLPVEFEGFRIVQLSDIHHSPYLTLEHITEAVTIANKLDPDLIVLTGDYITHTAEYIEPCVERLSHLKAKHGVYAVLGNHDVWVDEKAVTQAFEKYSIKVLDNINTSISIQNEEIILCGIGDLSMRCYDLPKALKGTSPSDTRILLSHNPGIIKKASFADIDLVLSGHTHGGQFHLPVIGSMAFTKYGRRYVKGLGVMKQTQIYVNRGLGTVFVPVRYHCPPEISLLYLLRSDDIIKSDVS